MRTACAQPCMEELAASPGSAHKGALPAQDAVDSNRRAASLSAQAARGTARSPGGSSGERCTGSGGDSRRGGSQLHPDSLDDHRRDPWRSSLPGGPRLRLPHLTAYQRGRHADGRLLPLASASPPRLFKAAAVQRVAQFVDMWRVPADTRLDMRSSRTSIGCTTQGIIVGCVRPVRGLAVARVMPCHADLRFYAAHAIRCEGLFSAKALPRAYREFRIQRTQRIAAQGHDTIQGGSRLQRLIPRRSSAGIPSRRRDVSGCSSSSVKRAPTTYRLHDSESSPAPNTQSLAAKALSPHSRAAAALASPNVKIARTGASVGSPG